MSSPLRILTAFDKWKGTLTAEQVGEEALHALATSRAIEGTNVPMSDGGEGFSGFIACLKERLHLEVSLVQVCGPRGHPVTARVAYGDGLAVLEMAECAGLELLAEAHRDPMLTTTYGVGQMIRHAVDRGATRLIVGVGGSATNDGGLGALQALGVRVVMRDGSVLREPACGRHLAHIASLSVPETLQLPQQMRVACDVNTLFKDAVQVFSEQKGSTEETRPLLQTGMLHLQALYEATFGVQLAEMAGGGAAGGLAGALFAVGASLQPGVDVVAHALCLEQRVKAADVVLTGEGSYDEQSDAGKCVSLVLRLCKEHRKPAFILCGRVSDAKRAPNVLAISDHFDTAVCLSDPRRCIRHVLRSITL